MHNGSNDLMFAADERNKHSIMPCNKPPIFYFANFLNDLGTSLESKHRNPKEINTLTCLCMLKCEDVSTDRINFLIHSKTNECLCLTGPNNC